MTTETLGIDYSWARPGAQAIKNAGFKFVMRYVPYLGDGGKGLTKDEIRDLRALDIAIGLVYESGGNRVLDGFDAGISDAQTCDRAVNNLGFPNSRPVYFAVDFDARPNQYPVLDQYFKGVGSVLGLSRVGVYGSYSVCQHCLDSQIASWFWQTYAWSGGRVFAGNVFQFKNGQELNGGAVDYNKAYGVDFGQWGSIPGVGLSVEDKERLDRLERILGPEAKLVEWDGEHELIASIDNLNTALTEHKNQPHGTGLVKGTQFTSEVI